MCGRSTTRSGSDPRQRSRGLQWHERPHDSQLDDTPPRSIAGRVRRRSLWGRETASASPQLSSFAVRTPSDPGSAQIAQAAAATGGVPHGPNDPSDLHPFARIRLRPRAPNAASRPHQAPSPGVLRSRLGPPGERGQRGETAGNRAQRVRRPPGAPLERRRTQNRTVLLRSTCDSDTPDSGSLCEHDLTTCVAAVAIASEDFDLAPMSRSQSESCVKALGQR
jgi:hypothetical protein